MTIEIYLAAGRHKKIPGSHFPGFVASAKEMMGGKPSKFNLQLFI
jgi:hypothetical protein